MTSTHYRTALVCIKISSHNHSAYISDVLRIREVSQISIVEFLTFQEITVLARPQIAGLHAVGLEKLLVGNSERLTNSLGYNLSLEGETEN